MSQGTDIAWCHDTVNYWWNCRKVNDECDNCYIVETPPFRMNHIKHGPERWDRTESAADLVAKLNLRPLVCERCGRGYKETMKEGAFEICRPCMDQTHHSLLTRRRVFSLSLGDIFDTEVPIALFVRAMNAIRKADRINHLLLSKRMQHWEERIQAALQALADENEGEFFESQESADLSIWLSAWLNGTAPGNVWIIGSAGRQKTLESTCKALVKIPAVIRGLSCEPLLENLHFDRVMLQPIDWVIVGGESEKKGSNKARPCSIWWIENVIHGARKYVNAKIFVKQFGDYCITDNVNADDWPDGVKFLGEGEGAAAGRALLSPKGANMEQWPEFFRIRELPSISYAK